MTDYIRVLCVDDEPDLLILEKIFLEKTGDLSVTTIQGATQAIELLKTESFDAIISDYQMSKTDGITFLKYLREKGDTTPFIIFTGKGREEVVIEAINSGADFYLQKGGDPAAQFAELSNKIQYAVARKRTETDLLIKNEELRVAYEKISANEERLLMSQEIGHTGSWEYNPDTGKIWGSAEALRMYGFPPIAGDIDTDTIGSCIPELERVNQALEDLIKLGIEYDLEFTINPADGSSPKIIRSIARIEKDEHGIPLKVSGVIQDISDLKKNAETLRETNAYLENLIHVANVPIIVWDPTFRITRINHAFELLTGRKASDVIGQPLEILFPPSQVDRSIRLIRTTLEGVRWETVELEIQHVNGSIRTIEWNSSTLYSADGRTPVATIAQGQDVTKQRRLEQERTVMLGQIQQNLAQLSILNDGIRNPLTVITLHAENIDNAAIAEQIIGQTQKIDEIVCQLDRRWLESEKVLSFLRRHHQLSFEHTVSIHNGEEKGENLPDTTEENTPVFLQEIQAELYTILDSIDAVVYVADMDTHELLFINRLGRGMFGDITGKKCFEIFHQDHDKECPFCTNSLLLCQSDPTSVYQWEYHDTKNDRWYDCRDRAIRWVDGRIVRLEIATDITERKEREEELREGEERYRKLVENITDYILVHKNGIIRFANAAMAISLGYTQEELVGSDLMMYFTPESQKIAREMMQNRDSGENILPSEVTILTKDGQKKITEVSGVQIQFEGETASLIVLTDVTEQRRALEELRENNELFSKFIKHSPIFTYIKSVKPTESRVLYASDNFDQMIGVKGINMAGKTMDELFPPEFAAKMVADDWAVVTNGRVLKLNEEFNCHYYISVKFPIFQGNKPLLAGYTIDITDLKLAEHALSESEERLGLALNVSQMGTWDLDLVNQTTWRSLRHDQIFGYDSLLPEWTYEIFLDHVLPEDRPLVNQKYNEAISQQHDWEFECRIRRRDGEIRWIWARGRIQSGQHGEAMRILGLVQDITERKQAEEGIHEAIQKLRLLTGITRHDIFNQLTGIKGLQNLAIEEPDINEAHSYLSRSLEICNQLESTIRFTTEYEDFGTLSSDWQRVHTIIESIKTEFSSGEVEICNQIPDDLEIYADPVIRKVFTIFFANAIRYGGDISFIRFSCSEKNDTLIIACEDDGVGIRSEEKDRIFNHGYGKNTGLGLFFAREILSITGLSIQECGTEGKGARFEIVVPAGKFRRGD